jgi:hypothetical protein
VGSKAVALRERAVMIVIIAIKKADKYQAQKNFRLLPVADISGN